MYVRRYCMRCCSKKKEGFALMGYRNELSDRFGKSGNITNSNINKIIVTSKTEYAKSITDLNYQLFIYGEIINTIDMKLKKYID